MVGSRFVKAVARAQQWHGDQKRKGTEIPYIAHLLAVASLVLEAGGDESLAIAALLHDAVEDVGVPIDHIEKEFGSRIARIVMACSDGTPERKRTGSNWEKRKRAYLKKLEKAPPDVLRVSCADKVHNARAIQRDLEQEGPRFWKRFNEKNPARQRWYYESLAEVFGRRIREPAWLPAELERIVQEIFPAEGT